MVFLLVYMTPGGEFLDNLPGLSFSRLRYPCCLTIGDVFIMFSYLRLLE